MDGNPRYSYGNSVMTMKELKSIKIFDILTQVSTVDQVMEQLLDLTRDGYSGIGQNLLMADNSGNIGYQMVAAIPVRKDKTPYIGCRVIDGT